MSKIAVITGGSLGIGYHISKQLLARGYKVYILARRANLCDLIDNHNCFAINTDIRYESQILKAKHIVESENQTISLLINCAGVGFSKPLSEITDDNYQEIFGTNVFGTIFITKHFFKMINNFPKLVCNISSIAGIKGFADWSLYSASRFAMEGFSESIRDELRLLGIRLMVIRPGSVDTPSYEHLSEEQKKDFMQPEYIAKTIIDIAELPKEACVENIFINNSVGDL